MKNKSFITSCLFSLAAVAQAQETPNIIFIYADDMGYGDLGCYGSKVNRTPNIDKLAAEGMRFTDFYSAATVSSPSRAALMTGRYAISLEYGIPKYSSKPFCNGKYFSRCPKCHFPIIPV